MNIDKAYNFKRIDELTSCSGTLANVSLQSLSDTNYDVVINLLPNDSEHAREEEKEDLKKSGIRYIHIPVIWDAPKHSDFEAFKSAMDSVEGKKIHIHCAANYRASAFYALYAYKNQGWSITKLNNFIASIWQLVEYPIWEKFVSELAGEK